MESNQKLRQSPWIPASINIPSSEGADGIKLTDSFCLEANSKTNSHTAPTNLTSLFFPATVCPPHWKQRSVPSNAILRAAKSHADTILIRSGVNTQKKKHGDESMQLQCHQCQCHCAQQSKTAHTLIGCIRISRLSSSLLCAQHLKGLPRAQSKSQQSSQAW